LIMIKRFSVKRAFSAAFLSFLLVITCGLTACGGGSQETIRALESIDRTLSTPFNTGVTINLLANVSSPNSGGVLSLVGAPTVSNGTFTMVGSTISVTPVMGFFGNMVVRYSVSDGKAPTVSSTITIVVNPPVPVPVGFVRQQLYLNQIPLLAQGTYVLQTRDELAAVWNSAPRPITCGDSADGTNNCTGPYVPPPLPSSPAIDFEESTAVVVSLGVGIFCYAPTVTEVARIDGKLRVKWNSNGPDGGTSQSCRGAAEMLTIAVVPKFTGVVIFERVPY
jgi:hypothetical protein